MDADREIRVKSLSSEAVFDPSQHSSESPAGGKKRAADGMQPFGWPCGRLREEGRRQVDIWPVCYCEFQILWLSLTLNLLEFFNLGIPETVPSQRLTSLLTRSPFSDPPLLTKRVLHTYSTRIPCLRGKNGTLQIPGPGSGFVLMSVCCGSGRLKELGLVCKGVGLTGVPRGSLPFHTYKPPDVTRHYLQSGWWEAVSLFSFTFCNALSPVLTEDF